MLLVAGLMALRVEVQSLTQSQLMAADMALDVMAAVLVVPVLPAVAVKVLAVTVIILAGLAHLDKVIMAVMALVLVTPAKAQVAVAVQAQQVLTELHRQAVTAALVLRLQ